MVKRQYYCAGGIVMTIILFILIVMLAVKSQNTFPSGTLNKRIENFERERDSFHLRERYQRLGGKYDLSTKETIVNNRILNEIYIEKSDPDDWKRQTRRSQKTYFDPIANLSESGNGKEIFEKISENSLFKLIQSMPKGAALHVKDMAMCSVDCLLELTQRDLLWICRNVLTNLKNGEHEYEYELLRFSKEMPTEDDDHNLGCKWILLSELRMQENHTVVDQKLSDHFTYRTGKRNRCELNHFKKLIHGLLTFEPVWSRYIQKSLEEYRADNVQYVEIFSTLPKLYNLQSKNFTILDTARLMSEATKIVARNKRFLGAMLVYEPPDDPTDRDYNPFLESALRLKHALPDFLAGINLASNVHYFNPLYFLSRSLIALQNEFDYFYHVDGINGNDVASNDENLIDAVLLGSKRITYQSALLRHPELLNLIRKMNVAIELSPVTIVKGTSYPHGCLSLLKDHPSALLFAADYPVIIVPEYSKFFNLKSTPLTHEFYLAFVGINSKAATLGTLKRLAMNSVELSSSRLSRKRDLLQMWSKLWDEWIEKITELEL